MRYYPNKGEHSLIDIKRAELKIDKNQLGWRYLSNHKNSIKTKFVGQVEL
jgi:hypothetical protein